MSHEPNTNRSERGFHHKGQSAPRAHTSWDPVAKWYARWSGSEGSEYHKTLAIPTVLDLLQPTAAETIADIGCGTGVLAPALPKGIRYIGIDASPRLLATTVLQTSGSVEIHFLAIYNDNKVLMTLHHALQRRRALGASVYPEVSGSSKTRRFAKGKRSGPF